MTKREKVEKGLDLCLGEGNTECKDCPYDAECEKTLGKGPSPLRRDALELLKEMEARNVIVEKRRILLDDSCDEAKYGEDIFYHCPSCNRILSRTHMNKNIHFCEECGQEVKWK